MKNKTIIGALLVFQFAVHAQESKKKPSWTDALPERKENPRLKVQIEKDDDFGLDRSSLGFDRDELSTTQETSQKSTSQQITNKIEIQKQLDNERKKNAAQLAKLKKLEAERLASEKLAAEKREAEKLEAERLAAEKREAERLVAEKREAQRLARIQQKEQEQIAAQKRTEQNNLEKKATATTPIAKQELQKKQVSTAPYKWKKIKNVAPVYPSRAARKKVEGWVDVEITINSMGKVTDAKVLRTKKNSHIFDNSALKAVRQWSYEPPLDSGIKTELRKTVRLVYQL